MANAQRTYLPAAGRDWALPLYDPLVKLLGADRARKTLLEQASVQPAHRILDIGCGTGTFVTLNKSLYPGAEVIGIDPDPKALVRARRKAAKAGVSVRFDQGFSDELPYPDAYFDRVFSSFMYHHLPAEGKEKTLREVRRVLAPGGSLHLVDFRGPEDHAGDAVARSIHSGRRLRDNSESRILALMNHAGFVSPEKIKDGALLFGHLRIAYYRATAPASAD